VLGGDKISGQKLEIFQKETELFQKGDEISKQDGALETLALVSRVKNEYKNS
jgi:hypothetical protein